VSFVANYEEGGERSILHGDKESEVYLQEVVGLVPRQRRRDESTESVYEYGSRAGFWRILREFEKRRLPFTSWAVGMALARNPDAGKAMIDGGHEVASHGWRWFDYQKMPIAEERRHFRMAIDAIRKTTGVAPVGWYTGRMSPNTRRGWRVAAAIA
jgi:chitin deacetylase